jgi:hypothetical protein
MSDEEGMLMITSCSRLTLVAIIALAFVVTPVMADFTGVSIISETYNVDGWVSPPSAPNLTFNDVGSGAVSGDVAYSGSDGAGESGAFAGPDRLSAYAFEYGAGAGALASATTRFQPLWSKSVLRFYGNTHFGNFEDNDDSATFILRDVTAGLVVAQETVSVPHDGPENFQYDWQWDLMLNPSHEYELYHELSALGWNNGPTMVSQVALAVVPAPASISLALIGAVPIVLGRRSLTPLVSATTHRA